MKKDKRKEYFDTIAPKRDSWKKRAKYYHREQSRLHSFLIPKRSNVLEIGSGTGDLLHAVDPKRGVGIDLSLEMLNIARDKYQELTFQAGDIEKLELDEKFDYIIMSDLIGHLDDVWQGFRELEKVCKKHTKLVVTFHNFSWEPILKLAEKLGLKMHQHFNNWLGMKDVVNLLHVNNFEVVKTGTRLLFPINIPIISTILNRYIGQLPLIRKLCLIQYVVARPRFLDKPYRDHSVSIIIPARNEKGNIENAVKRLPQFGSHQEIIYVEGGSEDNTFEEMNRVKEVYPNKDIKVFRQTGKGKGDAVRLGFSKATGDILMILDADLAVPPEDLPKFYQAIRENNGEFINGSRLVYPMEKEAMRFLNLLANKFFSLVFSWLLDQHLKDTLCGTKVLFREHYKALAKGRAYFGEFDPFGDFDLIFGASKLNLKIVEIPIRYRSREYGSTQISRFRHGILLIRMVIFAMRKVKFV